MVYFLSDVHLGSGSRDEARSVERRFVTWLQDVGTGAEAIFLCGDIFDFWFEYKYVIPKGFVRVFAEFARLTESGVRVVFVTGNHDMWVGDYLSEECGVEIYKSPTIFNLAGRRVHVAHGDNLNVKSDILLRLMNGIFRSQIIFRAFSAIIHPNLALRFGQWWSGSSRKNHDIDEGRNSIDGIGVRELIEYAEQSEARLKELGELPCDYYIYGHLHQLFRYRMGVDSGGSAEVIFINDWSESPTIAALDSDGIINQIRVK